MVRRETVGGVELVIEARAIGGLGWTWSYCRENPETGAGASNTGWLLPCEDAAFEAARAAAIAALAAGGT